jgi:hypothetical protein
VASGELGVLIPAWDNEFINSLTTIYDGDIYDEKRRGGDRRTIIEKPQINLIGAATPSYLHDVMPQGAWEQGFISRVILVFSFERYIVDLFPIEAAFRGFDDLAADLLLIHRLQGEMQWDSDALTLIRRWHLDGNPPIPTHTKLASYCTRRSVHALKLCMVSSASRGSSMRINLEDVKTALRWLVDVETYMPQIFTSFGSGGDEVVMADVLEFVRAKGLVPEHEVVRFIGQRVKSHNVMTVIMLMIKSRRLEQVVERGGVYYKARSAA